MNADEQAIRTLVAESVLRLMAEDVVFLVAGQPPMKGRSTFEKGLRGLLASHRLVSTGDVQEVGVSGNLAYCWSVLNVAMTPTAGGGTVVRSGSAVSILRKQPTGSWVVVRDANLLATGNAGT